MKLSAIDIEKEIWKDIPEYEGFYQVSNLGNVKSLSRQINNNYGNIPFDRILKPGTVKGYKKVTLSIDKKKKTFSVHRLVAICFLPNPKNYKEINHKDGNKANNKVTNLEWCSRSYNNYHKFNVLGYAISEETKQKLSKAHSGCIWSEEAKKRLSKTLKGTKKPGLNKKVKCITTGEIFNCIKEAAQAKGMSESNLSNCLAKRTKTAKKLQWEFI